MKKITRNYLEKLLNQKDWGKKGTDEREVALILICSGIVGAIPDKIEEVLGDPKGVLRKTTKLARENKIWGKDGKVSCEWLDKKTGTVALACDVAVCMGWLNRIEQSAKQLGSRGGKTTSKRYGKKHYQALAKNMNAKIAERKKGISSKNEAKI